MDNEVHLENRFGNEVGITDYITWELLFTQQSLVVIKEVAQSLFPFVKIETL